MKKPIGILYKLKNGKSATPLLLINYLISATDYSLSFLNYRLIKLLKEVAKGRKGTEIDGIVVDA